MEEREREKRRKGEGKTGRIRKGSKDEMGRENKIERGRKRSKRRKGKEGKNVGEVGNKAGI